MIKVERARVLRDRGEVRLEGKVREEVLYWSLPESRTIEPRGEPFVAALLPAAMRRGVPLCLPDNCPVDTQFLKNMSELQEIFVRWFPGLSKIEIEAVVADRAEATSLFATGYSGGVDSSHTVDDLRNELDVVLLIDGIEYAQRDEELIRRVQSTLEEPMRGRGLELLSVQTNVKAVGRSLGARWSDSLGGAIASCAHAANFSRYIIAGSNSWENLAPYGSHPLTDPLWSSRDLAIEHHGLEHRRLDKLKYLGGVPDLLHRLRVCFQGGDYNCGHCDKCLRTMAGLRALGLAANSVPELADPGILRRVRIVDDFDLVDWEEMVLPDLKSRDPRLHSELRRMVRRFRWRSVVREFDALALRGSIRRLSGRSSSSLSK